jgi:hypothetical protein
MRLLRAEFVRYAVKADDQIQDRPLPVGVPDYARCCQLLAGLMGPLEREAAMAEATAAIVLDGEDAVTASRHAA